MKGRVVVLDGQAVGGRAEQASLVARAMENLPGLFALVDGASQNILYANRACRRYARTEDATGRPLAELLPMVDLAAATAVASTGQAITRAAVPHGAQSWWDLAIVPVAGGALAVTAHDVTAHVRAQQAALPDRLALNRSEQRLRAILQQIPAAVFIVEAPDGRVALQSDVVDRVLGYPSHDLNAARGARLGWAEHADGREYDLAEYPSRRALLQGEVVTAEPMIYRRGDGMQIQLETYAGPVRDEAGCIVAAVTAALDVTARHEAEATLRESEARHRLAIEAGGLGTWEVNLTTHMIDVDAEAAAIFGLPPEPFSGDGAIGAALIHAEDLARAQAEFQAATAAGGGYHSEFRGLAPPGQTRWLVAHGRILQHPDGTAHRAVGVIRDVTERRTREDSLREALAVREMLVREADHRIKNSLQLVASLLGLQRARMHDPDAMAALDDAIGRVMAVSQAHRALQRSEDLSHIGLDQMLQDLCSHVGVLNPAVQFEASGVALLPLDTERAIPLGLIVSELLTNAAKHAYAGGGGTVSAMARCSDGWVEVSVADEGVGLTPDVPPCGGLGSTIIAALARKIGAAVTTVSAPGCGTCTTLRFPLAP